MTFPMNIQWQWRCRLRFTYLIRVAAITITTELINLVEAIAPFFRFRKWPSSHNELPPSSLEITVDDLAKWFHRNVTKTQRSNQRKRGKKKLNQYSANIGEFRKVNRLHWMTAIKVVFVTRRGTTEKKNSWNIPHWRFNECTHIWTIDRRKII